MTVQAPTKRCASCDGPAWDKDFICTWCKSPNLVAPYPPAKTIEEAVTQVFERDTKKERIVDGVLDGSWDERHGVESLAGRVASVYERGSGIDVKHGEACAAVRKAILAFKRAQMT